MPDLEPISLQRQSGLSFPHVDYLLTSTIEDFENLSLQSDLPSIPPFCGQRCFTCITTSNKCSLLNLQNFLLCCIKEQVNSGAVIPERTEARPSKKT